MECLGFELEVIHNVKETSSFLWLLASQCFQRYRLTATFNPYVGFGTQPVQNVLNVQKEPMASYVALSTVTGHTGAGACLNQKIFTACSLPEKEPTKNKHMCFCFLNCFYMFLPVYVVHLVFEKSTGFKPFAERCCFLRNVGGGHEQFAPPKACLTVSHLGPFHWNIESPSWEFLDGLIELWRKALIRSWCLFRARRSSVLCVESGPNSASAP